MAQKKNITTDSELGDSVTQATAHMVEAMSQQAQPETIKIESDMKVENENSIQAPLIHQIAEELADVANGPRNSVQRLRNKVAELYPTDETQGKVFWSQLKRLRDAADVALVIGTEMQSGLETK
jgi:hypothetical protein